MKYRDDFWAQLDELDMIKLAIGAVWPSPEVTPQEMGTDGGHGVNPIDKMSEFLALRSRTSLESIAFLSRPPDSSAVGS